MIDSAGAAAMSIDYPETIQPAEEDPVAPVDRYAAATCHGRRAPVGGRQGGARTGCRPSRRCHCRRRALRSRGPGEAAAGAVATPVGGARPIIGADPARQQRLLAIALGRDRAAAAAGRGLGHPARRTPGATGGGHRPVADAVAAAGQVGVAGAGGQRAGVRRSEGQLRRPDAPRAGPCQRRRRAQARTRGRPVRSRTRRRSCRWSSAPTRAPRPCWRSRRS